MKLKLGRSGRMSRRDAPRGGGEQGKGAQEEKEERSMDGEKINGWRRPWHGIETLAATTSWEPQPARLAAGPQPGPTATTSVTLELCSVSGMFV